VGRLSFTRRKKRFGFGNQGFSRFEINTNYNLHTHDFPPKNGIFPKCKTELLTADVLPAPAFFVCLGIRLGRSVVARGGDWGLAGVTWVVSPALEFPLWV
jgi:hypothetical protein